MLDKKAFGDAGERKFRARVRSNRDTAADRLRDRFDTGITLSRPKYLHSSARADIVDIGYEKNVMPSHEHLSGVIRDEFSPPG